MLPRCCVFRFPDVDLLGVGVSPGPERHVYLLITSDTYQDGRPVRVYPYGVFDAVDRKHSDFIVLKRLLMGDKVVFLIYRLGCCGESCVWIWPVDKAPLSCSLSVTAGPDALLRNGCYCSPRAILCMLLCWVQIYRR